MIGGISRGGGFYCRNPQNSPKYSLLAVLLCLECTSGTTLCLQPVCWGKAHCSLSISAPMLFYRDHGNILLFSLKTLKMDKWISPEFSQIFLSLFMSLKPELCEVTSVNLYRKRGALTSDYRYISNSTTRSISCLHWKSRTYKLIFF